MPSTTLHLVLQTPHCLALALDGPDHRHWGPPPSHHMPHIVSQNTKDFNMAKVTANQVLVQYEAITRLCQHMMAHIFTKQRVLNMGSQAR